MPLTLEDLAAIVGGTPRGTAALAGAATLETAGPADVTLVDSAEKLHLLARSQAGAAIVPTGSGPLDRPSIEVADVHAAFVAALGHFRPARPRPRLGVSPRAVVDPSARIADDVDIHPLAVVGADVEIGPGATIHAGATIMDGCRIGAASEILPQAVLYENTVVGARCVVHAGAVLGGHGFGYKVVDGRYRISAQLGWVELGDDVEIGAGTTIDRGTYGPTLVGDGTKIDNLVMIAHNCRIGRHNMICSQVGVRDHVHIGDRAVLGARSGVSNDIEAGKTVLGEPAIDLRDRKLQLATMSKLPEMRKDLKQLVARVEALEHPQPRSEAA